MAREVKQVTFGVFAKSDGPLIHAETGLALAPHVSQESASSESATDDFADLTQTYMEYIQSLLATGDYVVNTKAVAYEFKYMYEAPREPDPKDQEPPAKRPQNDLDEYFEGDVDLYAPAPDADDDEPANADALTHENLKFRLIVQQGILDGNDKRKGQKAVAVIAAKCFEGKSKGLSFFDEKDNEMYTFWDNSNGVEDDAWKNPYSKLPRDMGEFLWRADPQTKIRFNQPMIIAIKIAGKFTNFSSVMQFDGTWKEA